MKFHEMRQYRPGFNTIQLAKVLTNQDQKDVNELLTQLSKLKTEIAKRSEGLQLKPDVGPIACCCCCCN